MAKKNYSHATSTPKSLGQSLLRKHAPGLLRKASEKPVLRFSPTAWAKLLYFRDLKEGEVGGFGVSSADDLLFIEDFVTVKQDVTIASVSFHDQAVADFFENQVDSGRKPEQFARIWLHTHPGDCAAPSSIDEETFWRVFGGCQWAVMFILARNGQSSVRLRFNVGPAAEVAIPVEVDYQHEFGPANHAQWQAEYEVNVHASRAANRFGANDVFSSDEDLWECSIPQSWLDGLATMEPSERQAILDELAVGSDMCEEMEVTCEL